MIAIASLPLWLSLLLMVVVPTLIIVLGPVVVRRLAPFEVLSVNNEVAGFKFATLGVVYAVLLGLAVISTWEKFADAENAATTEAAAVVDMHRLAGGIDPAAQPPLHDALVAYGRSVVTDDWPAMSSGHASPKTLDTLNALYATVLALPADNLHASVMQSALISQLDTVTSARRDRLILARGIVPNVIWLVLFIGAAVTLGFTFFFALPSLRIQLAMTAMLSVLIFLALFVAVAVDYPFTGPSAIDPRSMNAALADFGDASS